MTFKPVRKLMVTRTLATGQAVTVGALAQSRQGVFFQYDVDYLGRSASFRASDLYSSE
ncbi:hypothetical protein ACEK07_17070 [Alcanivoracaceae bacterium MT1]